MSPLLDNIRRLGRFRPGITLGTSGTNVQGGYIVEVERSPDLRGTRKYTTYSDILANATIVAAGTRYYLNLVSKAGWNVEPADKSDEAIELAEFTEDVMNDMETPWYRVMRRAAMYRMYGYSIQEWTAKQRTDGQVGFLDVEPRPQKTIERWAVEDNGRVLAAIQRSPQTQEEIVLPRNKIVYVVDDSLSDSPEGLGLYRHLVQSANRLFAYQRLEEAGYESDLRGVPIGRAPLSAIKQAVTDGLMSAEEANQITKPLKDFMSNHIRTQDTGMLFDSDTYTTVDDKETPSTTPKWNIELLKGGSSGLDSIAAAINRVNHEMARVLGVEQLLLGTDSSGSFALARVKAHNLFLVVDSALKELAWTFRQDWVRALWRLNGFPMELLPTLKPEAIQFRDIEQVTSAIEALARSGAPLDPDDPVIDDIRDLAGVSRRDMDALAAATLVEPAAPEPEPVGDPDDEPEEPDINE